MDKRVDLNVKMNAAVLHAVDDLRYEETAMPETDIENGGVLLRIRASGICGSDLPRIFSKGTYKFPTIPGHEFSGEVIECGDKNLIGKKAAVFPLLPCGKCASCEIGEYAQCEDYDYYGSRRDGGFAEYIAVKEWNLVFAPGELSFEEMAMCEPAAVALCAINQARIQIGETVVIYGAGAIGMMLAQWARISGASRVAVADIDRRKIDFAEKLGFSEYDGSYKADVAIEGAGAESSLENCLKVTKKFGRVVLMGNPSGDMNISQNAYWEILRKRLTLTGTWNSSYNVARNDWRTSLEAMAAKRLDVLPLITHKYELKDCNAAFDMMAGKANKKEFYNKVMFCIK